MDGKSGESVDKEAVTGAVKRESCNEVVGERLNRKVKHIKTNRQLAAARKQCVFMPPVSNVLSVNVKVTCC